jgi:hypothetical protein
VLSGTDEFIAYEYQQGPASEFFKDLVDYLTINKLQTLLGVQVLSPELCGPMFEFILDEGKGTIMLKAGETKYGDPFRTTGWTFCDGVPQDGKSHAPTVRGTHQVFTNRKVINNVSTLSSLER